MNTLPAYSQFLLSLMAVLLGLSVEAGAQQQKIGYVNTDAILEKMPEYNGIDQQLRKLSQSWKEELERMQNEIDNLKEEFAAKEILYTDELRKKQQQQIQQRIQQREQYLQEKFGSEGEYFQRQKSLLEPIQRKVFEAINAVAERNDYDFVFDRSGDTSMLYFNQEWNLNDEVLIELGITQNQSSN